MGNERAVKAEREAEAQLAIVRALKDCDEGQIERVLRTVGLILEADKLSPEIPGSLQERAIAMERGRQAYFEALRRIRALVCPDDSSRKVRVPDTIAAIERLVLEAGDLQRRLAEAEAQLAEERAKYARLVDRCRRDDQEIQQTLGRALGYPKYSDHQEVFPGAVNADGVCVGEHVGVTLATEAAKELADKWQCRRCEAIEAVEKGKQ